MSFVVNFTPDERMVVDAELSLAARMLASDANRKQAVQIHRIDRRATSASEPVLKK